MMSSDRKYQNDNRPTVAVLVGHWEAKTESGWITRQVAGALACVADVHVITPDGRAAGRSVDGVFSLHRLATPIDTSAELRRDLVVEALSMASLEGRPAMTPELTALMDERLIEPWSHATEVLKALQPDLIVIAGHQTVGALAAVDRSLPDTPVALLALGTDSRSMAIPHFDKLFDRARSILTVTETERSSVAEARGGPSDVHRIGAPMAANPSALNEPNTWVGPTDYILVVTGTGWLEEGEETDLSRLIRLRFPDNPVGIAHTDSFCAWHQGRLNQGWAIERSSDMARLMAWARVTVDLRPGRLFARRCVESLLFGTPIVVPDDSRAREHAERGRGGLWFSNPAELIWSVEALLEPATRETFSVQGRHYAEEEYGSTDRFIERVVDACGLRNAAIPAQVTT